MDRSLIYRGLSAPASVGKSYLVLFILWPFLAFVIALANYTQKEARMVIYFFMVYFGLTFVVESEIMDSFRYMETFRFFGTLPFKEIFKAVGGYYSFNASVDFMEPMLSFLISRVTSNHQIFFGVFAALFAFFYLRSFNLLYDQYRQRPNWNAWVFMAFSVIVIPITSLSVLRMWIAAWMFFYGAYQLLSTHKSKYLLFALSACLMHWSFISLNLLLIIYYFAGNRNYIYTPMAIVSFFIPHVVYPFLEYTGSIFGGGIQARVAGYSGESHSLVFQDYLASTSWFLRLNNELIWYFFLFAVIVIRVFYRNSVRGKLEENWYSFLLLIFTLVNLGRSIPDFGLRMQTVFILFASVYVFLFYKNLGEKKLKLLTYLALVPLLLYTFIQFRIGADSMNAWLFAPGFGLPLLDPAMSLAEVFFN